MKPSTKALIMIAILIGLIGGGYVIYTSNARKERKERAFEYVNDYVLERYKGKKLIEYAVYDRKYGNRDKTDRPDICGFVEPFREQDELEFFSITYNYPQAKYIASGSNVTDAIHCNAWANDKSFKPYYDQYMSIWTERARRNAREREELERYIDRALNR